MSILPVNHLTEGMFYVIIENETWFYLMKYMVLSNFVSSCRFKFI
jgi:hypothetical protein